MLARRAIARPRRRAVYPVLGCILAAALGAAAATQSWIALTVELGLVLALLAVMVLFGALTARSRARSTVIRLTLNPEKSVR